MAKTGDHQQEPRGLDILRAGPPNKWGPRAVLAELRLLQLPVQNENAVHSLNHEAVWITYQPDLPAKQVDILRGLAREECVLVSPYPDLYAHAVATAWRNQLALEGVDDPRLRQFVDQFRISETTPRSGNGCTGGIGEPEL